MSRPFLTRRHIISLLESQIKTQEREAHEIRATTIDAAALIANELNSSADELRSYISHFSADLVDSIHQATTTISEDIDQMGKRVCACLLLLGWVAVQQSLAVNKILAALLDSRNNEARQLAKQGLRHLEVGEYSEAEQRFLLALNYDSTDFQTLLNLAFVKAQQGDSSAAHSYFRKSVTLPEKLNKAAKELALWAWARLHRQDGNYDSALEKANQAMSLQKQPDALALFTTGAYAGLKGDLPLCISKGSSRNNIGIP